MTPRRGSRREYPRTARVGELVREVVAGATEGLDDDRLDGVAVTGVDVAPELRSAVVWIDADDPEAALAALDDHRIALQSAIGAETRLRHTPVLEFRIDTAISTGSRVEEILSGLEIPPEDAEDSGASSDREGPAGGDP